MQVSGKRICDRAYDDTLDAVVSSVPQSTVSLIVKENCFYYPMGSTLDCSEDNRYEFKGYFALTWGDIIRGNQQTTVNNLPHSRDLPRNILTPDFTGKKPISRSLCAMANSPDGGVVLCGVTDAGRVGGLPFSVQEKEHIMLAVGDLFSRFSPPIGVDRYRVNFVPVLKPNEIDEYIQCQASGAGSDAFAEFSPDSLPYLASRDTAEYLSGGSDCSSNLPTVEGQASDSTLSPTSLNFSNVMDTNLLLTEKENSKCSDSQSNCMPTKLLLNDEADGSLACMQPLPKFDNELLNQRLLLTADDGEPDLPVESGEEVSRLLTVDDGSGPKVHIGDAVRDSPSCESGSSSTSSSSSSDLPNNGGPLKHNLCCYLNCWCLQQRLDRFTEGIATRRYVLRIEMLPQAYCRISFTRSALSSGGTSAADDTEADRHDEVDTEDDDASDCTIGEEDEFLASEPLALSMPVFVEDEEKECRVRSLGANRCLSLLQAQQLAESRAMAALDDELVEVRRNLKELRLLRDQLIDSI